MASKPSEPTAADLHEKHLNQSLGQLKKGTQWILSLGLAGLLGVTANYLWKSKKSDSQDAAVLSFAQANSPEALEGVVNNFPGQPVEALARLQLASFQFNQGEYEQSLHNYDAFLTAHPDHPMRNCASLGRLMCQEILGQVQEALDGYTAISADDVLYPQAQFGRARCLEKLDRLEEARDVYVSLSGELPDTIWASQADEFKRVVDRLLRRNS